MTRDNNLTSDVLYELYVIKNKTVKEIAVNFELSVSTVYYKLRKAKINLSLNTSSRHLTDEQRYKISERRSGSMGWSKGLNKVTDIRMLHKSIAQTGKQHTDEEKIKISLGNLGKEYHGPKHRPDSSVRLAITNIGNKYNFGKKASAEKRRKMSENIGAVKRLPENRAKSSKIAKEQWSNPEYISKLVRKEYRPNKYETEFLKLLDFLFPNQWKYVGGGDLIIGIKNPDFISVNGINLLELYGDYWHMGQNPQERIDYFEKYGYKTEVVWTHEFKDIVGLKNRLVELYLDDYLCF